MKYEHKNAGIVLMEVEKLLDRKAENPKEKIYIEDVYESLSIFEWFKKTLSIHELEAMECFLKEAIKLGCIGYVCFEVGKSGCANGMWAYVEESEDGYAPNEAYIYRSFTPDYVTWRYTFDGKTLFPITKEVYKEYDRAIPYQSITKRIMERHLLDAEYLVDMENLSIA